MKSSRDKFEKTELTAELFYTAFLGMSNSEKEKFISRFLGSLNKTAVVFTSGGKSLNKKKYSEYITAISNSVKEGDFIDHSDIEKEFQICANVEL